MEGVLKILTRPFRPKKALVRPAKTEGGVAVGYTRCCLSEVPLN